MGSPAPGAKLAMVAPLIGMAANPAPPCPPACPVDFRAVFLTPGWRGDCCCCCSMTESGCCAVSAGGGGGVGVGYFLKCCLF
jgi:hypothetical protein